MCLSRSKLEDSLAFLFCFFMISSIKWSIILSKSKVHPSRPRTAKYPMGPFIQHIVVFRLYVLSKKDTEIKQKNRSLQMNGLDSWRRKVEVLKSLIRCSEKSFQLLQKRGKKKEKRKKETKFYFEGCVPRTSPLIFLKNHLSCLFHSSLEVNRFRECTAAIETFRRRTETACSVSALLVYFNQKALKLRKKITFCLVWNMVCLTRDVILTSC